MAVSIKLKHNKIKLLQKYLRNRNINLALLEKIDAKYFTGTSSDFLMIIPANGKCKIFTSLLDIGNYRKNKAFSLKPFQDFRKQVTKNKTIGLNYQKTTIQTKNKLKGKKKDISGYLAELRQTKTAEELRKIRISCIISCKILAKAIKKINKGLFSEKDIKRYLESETFKHDCTLAFTPVVASGMNAAIPHACSTDRKLRRGFLIIDFGVKYQGYCSDMTRTVFIGKPTKKEREIYEKVLFVQQQSIKKIKQSIGKKMNILDNYARELFKESKKYFTHSLGHGFGLEIHEAPWVSSKSTNLIKENEVITIEPGYYDTKQKIGIRIEDDILIKSNGFEVLTSKLPKKLIVIK